MNVTNNSVKLDSLRETFKEKLATSNQDTLVMKPCYLPESLSANVLNLKIPNGHISVYRDDYIKKLKPQDREILENNSISSEQKLKLCEQKGLLLTVYFNPKHLQNFKVQDISHVSKIKDILGNRHQNCLVVTQDGNVYLHPKVRGTNTPIQTIGINHSSLSNGDRVKFAGSLIQENDKWILENTTGHYGTRPSKLADCLKAFGQHNISTSDLTVRHWIVIDNDYLQDKNNQEYLSSNSAKIVKTPDQSYLVEDISADVLVQRMNNLKS